MCLLGTVSNAFMVKLGSTLELSDRVGSLCGNFEETLATRCFLSSSSIAFTTKPLARTTTTFFTRGLFFIEIQLGCRESASSQRMRP